MDDEKKLNAVNAALKTSEERVMCVQENQRFQIRAFRTGGQAIVTKKFQRHEMIELDENAIIYAPWSIPRFFDYIYNEDRDAEQAQYMQSMIAHMGFQLPIWSPRGVYSAMKRIEEQRQLYDIVGRDFLISA